MNDLIQELVEKVGINPAQAEKALLTVKEYIVTKFPMLEGAVENMFPAMPIPITPVMPELTLHTAAPVVVPVAEDPSVLDKISDVIPGETGEKIETFAKNAAHKAAETFENVKDKLSDMFGNDKK